MHRRAVVCTMCGGKFFPASLEFHQKACARKQNFVLIPCPYCDVEVPKPELETHISTACKKAPKSAHKPKNAAAGGQGGGGEYPEGGEGGEPLFDEAGRMCCPVCNRWFNQDRIGKHQAICRKLEERGKRPRPVFDSFKQRKFDPLIQRSDIEERQAKALASGATDAGALKAARSYYTTERVLQNSGKEASSSLSTKSSIAQAAKKSKGPAATAGEGAETAKPPTTARRASGATTTQQGGGSRKPRDDGPAVGSPSRPATTAGGRRASDTGTRVAKKPAPGPSTVAAARSAAAGAKAGEAGHSPTAQKNKQRPSLQNRSVRGPPFRMGGGGSDARNAGSSAIGRRGGGGGGAILETNEASAENTLAYPNYPATGYDLRSRPDVNYAPPSPTRTARPPPPRASQAVNVSRGGPAARGAILPTNETSADNPLAYPFQ